MAEGTQSVATEAGTEHAATTEAHGGAVHADPTALGLNATAIVAMAMIVVIVLMIWKKVPALIGAALDKKISAIRVQLDDAARLRADAEALKAEYEAKAQAAAGEAEAILAHARDEADGIVAQARADAANLIERRGKMAENKIAAAERAAVAEVRAKAASAAAAAATKLISERHDAGADKALVDQTIAGLGGRLN
jgi:F-type H+-transporting ATPase subunit b